MVTSYRDWRRFLRIQIPFLRRAWRGRPVPGGTGHPLSCDRASTFREGSDDRVELTRTQTNIQATTQGASRCGFRGRDEIDDPGDALPQPPRSFGG